MAAPKIEKLLTPYNFTNKDNAGRIKYIVIHYVGALGGAEANCKYYASKYLGASAHYFVGFNGEVWQSVEDEDIAWHCGASSYKHAECRNSNSAVVPYYFLVWYNQVLKGSCTDTLTYFIHRIHICQILPSVDGIMSCCTVRKDIDELLIEVFVIVKELLMSHIPLIIVCRSCPLHCCHLKDKFRMLCCCYICHFLLPP